jgi:RND family efflux transporter MFP subunit
MAFTIKKRYLLIIFFLITIIALFYYTRKQSNTYSQVKEEEQTYVVKPRSLRSVLNLSGTVSAEEQVTLQFQISGRLSGVYVKKGDYVTVGQTIASLDTRELRKKLDKELKDYMTKRWDHDQLKDDYEESKTDQHNTYLTDEISRIVQKSQFGLDQTVIDVELSSLSLELAYLTSPINGIVTHLDQEIAGVNITPSQGRFQIVNPTTLFLTSTVDEYDVVKIETGDKATITFDAFPDVNYIGSVYFVSFSPSDTEENAYDIKISLPPTVLNKLKMGMSAEIEIVTAKKTNVLAVPFMAVEQTGKKNYITILKNNKRIKKEVVLGIETDEYIEIKKGLRREDVVVY